ncbi:hypothetical protein C2G38_2031136 [Gigaspora rosea]|uniref:Uncharacterized protein n=1 Tax=Gigaspora rosea TaxID=44941 RepID=A0A397VUA4_9GLOM|nr:hypothetical protein C2G38_2031136 [Gigaspora rosea]
MEHIVALDESNNVSHWTIVNQEQFLTNVKTMHIEKICTKEKGKLIIFNDTIYEITMWDIEELSIKTRILIEWDHILESIEISDDEELLFICAKSEKTEETRLYVFSTETGINLAFFTQELTIDRLHLIASRKGERLLYISGEQYKLTDPYNLKNQIDARKVLIEELVPDNWVEYLRPKLMDTNSITTPSKKTTDIIIENRLINDYDANRKEFTGNFLKWGLELDDKSVRLTVIDFDYQMKDWNPDDKKKHLDILPSFYANEKILYYIVKFLKMMILLRLHVSV